MAKPDVKVSTPSIGETTPEQLTAWKAKYGKVFTLAQEDDAGVTHLTYVCKPTFEQVQSAFQFLNEDVIKTGKMLLADCRLGGSDFAHTDPEFKIGLCTKMVGFFKPKMVTEVKEV